MSRTHRWFKEISQLNGLINSYNNTRRELRDLDDQPYNKKTLDEAVHVINQIEEGTSPKNHLISYFLPPSSIPISLHEDIWDKTYQTEAKNKMHIARDTLQAVLNNNPVPGKDHTINIYAQLINTGAYILKQKILDRPYTFHPKRILV